MHVLLSISPGLRKSPHCVWDIVAIRNCTCVARPHDRHLTPPLCHTPVDAIVTDQTASQILLRFPKLINEVSILNNLNLKMLSFSPQSQGQSYLPQFSNPSAGCVRARQALSDFLRPGNPLNNPNLNPANEPDRNRLMSNRLHADMWRECPRASGSVIVTAHRP